MRSISTKQILLTAFLWLCLALHGNAASWNEIVAQVDKDVAQTREAVRETRKIVQEERGKLQKELAELRGTVEQDEAGLKALKAQFETMLQTEETLRGEIEQEEEAARALEETIRTLAKDADEMIQRSLITAEQPSRRDAIRPMLDTERFPGMDDIETLAAVFSEEMAEGGKIRKRSGTFVNAQGAEVSGTILRIGKFTACYQLDGEVGYLRLDKDLQKLVAIPGKPPWGVRRAIRKYFFGESVHMPLDLTGGIIAEQVNQGQGVREWLDSGGLLVWPILIIAVVAMLLSLERLFSLGRIPTKTDKLMDRLRDLLSKGDVKGGQELCQKNPGIPTCNVLKAGLESVKASREVMENILEEAILKELPRLERFLSTLGVLAAIAPLLGLLGTVTGMIHTFQGITVFGTSDPRMMSGGISEALVTTQMGLAVAIPIMIAHHFFDRRVEKIIGDMEEKGTAVMALVVKSEE
ncbi:MAG: hypothetical protein B6245_06565 [Desulfobacteraceae bacterium 4572_88]|nr:MAG: hypothetical protein B6245_06565 [Desulfobacteraceae bacterium 4572_88]